MKKYIVTLSPEEKEELQMILHKGNHPASVRDRAQALLFSAKGLKDESISELLEINVRSVCNIRKKYCEAGLRRTVCGERRSGRPRKITTRDEADIVALACSDPPAGHVRWTLELLKEHSRKPIGKSSIQIILKKMNVSPGSERCGVSENSTRSTGNGCII